MDSLILTDFEGGDWDYFPEDEQGQKGNYPDGKPYFIGYGRSSADGHYESSNGMGETFDMADEDGGGESWYEDGAGGEADGTGNVGGMINYKFETDPSLFGMPHDYLLGRN